MEFDSARDNCTHIDVDVHVHARPLDVHRLANGGALALAELNAITLTAGRIVRTVATIAVTIACTRALIVLVTIAIAGSAVIAVTITGALVVAVPIASALLVAVTIAVGRTLLIAVA
jgi:hypothetical protein